jgi:hypothetical protein
MRADSSPRELASWKQIAEFLGVTVRTAQKWERERGLPVRRAPGKRGMVSADPAELAGWKISAGARPGRAGTVEEGLRGAAGRGMAHSSTVGGAARMAEVLDRRPGRGRAPGSAVRAHF